MTADPMPHAELCRLLGLDGGSLRRLRSLGLPFRQLQAGRPGVHGGGTYHRAWAEGVAALLTTGASLPFALRLAQAWQVDAMPGGGVTVRPKGSSSAIDGGDDARSVHG